MSEAVKGMTLPHILIGGILPFLGYYLARHVFGTTMMQNQVRAAGVTFALTDHAMRETAGYWFMFSKQHPEQHRMVVSQGHRWRELSYARRRGLRWDSGLSQPRMP